MRTILLTAALLCSTSAFAQTCNPGNTSGCPTTIPGTIASLTPTTVTGSSYTVNGVTDTVSVINQINYNNSVCPGTNTTGGGGCTITEFMPTGAITNPSKYFVIWVFHGGGGSLGNDATSDAWASSTGCCQRSITYVQQFLGTPNPVGGKGFAIMLVNFRNTAGQTTPGQNFFPAQWQDAKCSVWHVLANSSSFPGNYTTIGFYGPSYGGNLVGNVVLTPDNQYTTSCDSSAPSTPPVYRAVGAWPPLSLAYSATGTLGNGPFENVTATCAFRSALIGQFYLNTDTTITTFCANSGYYGSQTIAQVSSTIQGHISAASPPYDPAHNIPTISASVLGNVSFLAQFGTPAPNGDCVDGDCLVCPYWTGSGCTNVPSSANGGELYNLSAAFTGTNIHPFMQILEPTCIHECDTNKNPSPSQIDAINYLMATGQPLGGGGLGGNL